MKPVWSKDDVERTYHISEWGEGHFSVDDDGHLVVNVMGGKELIPIKIWEVIEEMKKQKLALPAVIRFQDLLRHKVSELNETFAKVIEKNNYKGRYTGVYPIKVNQMREVVEEIIDAGKMYDYGLEAGSKTELMAILGLEINPKGLIIINGHKDRDYLTLALMGQKLEKNVFIVIEKLSELNMLLDLSKEMNIRPLIGLRAKMFIKSGGKWEDSSGERSQFGLRPTEIITVCKKLKEENLLDCLQLLHFHIGSQICDIKSINGSITEGTRILSSLVSLGAPIKYMDIGGGLGVDYDGSHSVNNSSKNYTLLEYVNAVVTGIANVCDSEEIPHPIIVTESGRAVTALHSCVILEAFEEVSYGRDLGVERNIEDEHYLTKNTREVLESLKEDNVHESYNKLKQIKEESLQAFKLGIIGLEELSAIDSMTSTSLKKIISFPSSINEFPTEDYHELREITSSQYICNFSVFQSILDSWAIDQLLPVVPIHRLNERPDGHGVIVDITCDSDGKIDNFIGEEEVQKTLQLHEIKNSPYYLGIFLTGAYQDVMGDMHNLFGRLNEVHVYADETDSQGFYLEEVIAGPSSDQILSTMQYNPGHMSYRLKKEIDAFVAQGKVRPREGVQFIDFYEDCLKGYTYLNFKKQE